MSKLEKFLPFAPPLMGDEEIAEVVDTLKSGWLTTGPKTERFEKDMAAFLGAESALAVNSCTSALHLALNVLDVGPGQGVLTTPLTFASTAHAVMYQGAAPFFVDIDRTTGNLCPEAARRFLTEECVPGESGRPRHKATGLAISTLLPVHYGGHAVDLAALWRLALEFNLNMVEDAAHAIGSTYRGRLIGNPLQRPPQAAHLKNLCAFSFYATKNMATGEGGLLTSSDPELLEKARVRGMYGISDSRKIWGRYAPKGTWVYDVAELGFKYNFTDIQAALGLHQLKKLPGFIRRRAEHADRYNQALAGLEHLAISPEVKSWAGPAWHLYPLRLRLEKLKIGRDDFIQALRDRNVGTSVLFIPLHYHSYYRDTLGYGEGAFPEAEKFFQGLVNLPLAPVHSPHDVQAAAAIVAELLREHAA